MAFTEIDRRDVDNKLTDEINQMLDVLAGRQKEMKDLMLTCGKDDIRELEHLIYQYEYIEQQKERVKKTDIRARLNAVDLFNKMAYDLSKEFDADVSTEYFTISFKWFGRSISYVVQMIAKMYNLHSGMFGFSSSFTTHDAYTEDNYEIKIGISDEDSDTIIIRFGKIDEINFMY